MNSHSDAPPLAPLAALCAEVGTLAAEIVDYLGPSDPEEYKRHLLRVATGKTRGALTLLLEAADRLARLVAAVRALERKVAGLDMLYQSASKDNLEMIEIGEGLEKQVTALQSKLADAERMRQALEFYSDGTSWRRNCFDSKGQTIEGNSLVESDRGARARAALAPAGSVPPGHATHQEEGTNG